jgi:hypothetical protein
MRRHFRSLTLAAAAALVSLAFFSTPQTATASRPGDFCDPWWGCRTVTQGGVYQCVCDDITSLCTICCLQGVGCCWDATHCDP